MSLQWWSRLSPNKVRAIIRHWFKPRKPPALHRPVPGLRRGRRLILEELEDRLAPSFSLGAASNYAILYEGGGSNTLQITNVKSNVSGSGLGQGGGIGNIGAGGAAKVNV